jgi:uncharacterized membrane protein YfcA
MSGCLSGTFGSGAALLLMPFFVSFNILPAVASAVCGINYLFISASSIISIATNGFLSFYEIILFFSLAFLGGFVIARILYFFVEKKNA